MVYSQPSLYSVCVTVTDLFRENENFIYLNVLLIQEIIIKGSHYCSFQHSFTDKIKRGDTRLIFVAFHNFLTQFYIISKL
nr:unnamed protein product [Callosobruchus analis]